MTLSGDLLNLPLDITFTRLRAVRRKGVNEHGPVQMSGTEATLFVGFSAKNVAGEHQRYWTARRVVLVSAPEKGLKRVKRHQVRKEQEPAATSEKRQRKRRCPLQPGVSLPGCGKRR